MKTKKLPKHRAHRILFDNDLPFQPKRQITKNVYRRRGKHVDRNEYETFK